MHSESVGSDRLVLRRATERLLAWGFMPKEIARQLDCSVSWVYSVRRERDAFSRDVEERPIEMLRLIYTGDS
ncbi:MAG: hypothetical protein NVSMB52_12770 [Chloroflexota bacterium]